MTIAHRSASTEVEELSPADAAEAFDRISRDSLQMSGSDFLEALDAGKFEGADPDSIPGLLDVLMALPLVR